MRKILLFALITSAAACFSGCTSLRSLFEKEVGQEMAKGMGNGSAETLTSDSTTIISEKDLESLPPPVQRYFRFCNFVGMPKPVSAKIEWKDAALKRNPDSDWMPLECVQYNFVTEPSRIVFMSSAMWGLFPFQGRDKYQDGHGNMYIRLMGMFTVGDFKSVEIDKSALVTVLAEVPMVPGYAFQRYIQWKAIDSLSASASITFNNTTVSGVFHFTEQGEFYRFDTEDRFMTADDSVKNYKWSAIVEDYGESRGVKHAKTVKAMWHTEGGDHVYWKGEISDIIFGLKTL